jgi:hypothetical protein
MYTGYWAAWNEEECTYFATNSSMYFYMWIRVPTTQQVRAILGAHDYFKLWINHTLVMSRTSGGPATYLLDQYQQTATLNQGWNLILFKHSFPQLGPPDDPNPDNIYKYFSLRFTTPGGVPVHPIAGFDPMCSYSERDGQYTRVIVPSIAHLPGSGGSQWRTDTLLVNGTHMTWNYELNYFREGNASGTPNAVARLDVPPYGTVSFADALRHSGLFGVSSDQKGYFDVRRQLRHADPRPVRLGWDQLLGRVLRATQRRLPDQPRHGAVGQRGSDRAGARHPVWPGPRSAGEPRVRPLRGDVAAQRHLRRPRGRGPQHRTDRALPADSGEPERHLLVPLRRGQ